MGAGGDLLQPQHRRGGFLLAQYQWRQAGPRAELVAATGSARRDDRIADLLETEYIAADGPLADIESAGEIGTGPVATALQ